MGLLKAEAAIVGSAMTEKVAEGEAGCVCVCVCVCFCVHMFGFPG